jgi:hypothetical protein
MFKVLSSLSLEKHLQGYNDSKAMLNSVDHISICICTFKRPKLLYKLLDLLPRQIIENSFTYSVVVVD